MFWNNLANLTLQIFRDPNLVNMFVKVPVFEESIQNKPEKYMGITLLNSLLKIVMNIQGSYMVLWNL